MSQSSFSGGSSAQGGGSGFSGTKTSGSSSIQLKKLTMRTAAGRLVVSPDVINFKVTGADGLFYDSKYKGDSISLPVTSVFDKTSVTGSSSLVIDKNGLSVPVFDLNFGPYNTPSGSVHNSYTRQISIDTNGLTIPFTDVLLGTLGEPVTGNPPRHEYTRANAFFVNGRMNCPDIFDLSSDILTNLGPNPIIISLPATNQPQFTLTNGGGDPGTVLINRIKLTVTVDGNGKYTELSSP